MYTKISSLILNSGEKENSISEIFIAQPDAIKEKMAGKLFVLIEVEAKKSDALKVVNFLIDHINYSYYQDEKIMLRDKIENLTIENIFESIIVKANKSFNEFLEKEKIRIDLKDINATIGVIYQDKLYFSSIGNNKSLLIYRKGDEYELINIEKSSEDKKAEKVEVIKQDQLHNRKIFSSVISGEIPKNSFFIFTNEALPEYISNKELIGIITRLQPMGAAEQIKNTLTSINSYVPFLGIIIKNTLGLNTSEEELGYTDYPAEKSISNLNYTEEKTEKLLSPSGVLNFKKLFKKIADKFIPKIPVANVPKDKLKAKDKFTLKDRIVFKKKPSFVSIKRIGNNIINVFNKRFFIHLYKNFKKWINNLNKNNKFAFVGLAILIIILLGNLFITNIKNKQEDKKLARIELIETIKSKQNQIDSYLLYNNEERALEIVNELKIMISEMPQKKKSDIELHQELLNELATQLEKIQHIVRIDDAQEIINISSIKENANTMNLEKIENALYIGDSNNDSVYKISLDNDSITTIESPKLNKHSTVSDKFFHYLSGNKVIELNSEDDSSKELDINWTGINSIDDIYGFANNIYVLDNKNNQIYKYPKRTDSFLAKSDWIKDGTNISGAVSISIDGNIYVLKNNGEIIKFLKGNKEEFKLGQTDPAVSDAKKIIVTDEHIYISENDRVIVFLFNNDHKSAKFVAQYKADSINNINDFLIDESNKEMYILNNTSVLRVNVSHLD